MTIPTAPAPATQPTPLLSVRALAVHSPLLLFTSGILRWVDAFDGRPGSGWPWYFAQLVLVAALAGFAGLSRLFVTEARRLHLSSWILLAGAAATISLTRELLPLAALLALIGLAPLTHVPDGLPASPSQGMPGSGHDSPVELSMSIARSATTVSGSVSAMAVTTTGSCAAEAPVATDTCGTQEPGS